MKEKWEAFKESLTDVVLMSKKDFLLTVAVCILGGIVFGLLFSPRKITLIGCGNGNSDNGCGDVGCAQDGCGGEKAECRGKKNKKCRKSKKAKDEIVDWEEVEEKELGAEA